MLLGATLSVPSRGDDLPNAKTAAPLLAPGAAAEETAALAPEAETLTVGARTSDEGQGEARGDAQNLRLPGSIQLQWDAQTDQGISETVVERLDPDSDAFSVIASVASAASGYIDRGLEAGRTYCYRVRTFWAGSVVHSVRTCRPARFEY